MKAVLITSIAFVASSVLASPSFNEAEQWRRDFSQATASAATPSAPATGKKLSELQQRAEKLFGKPEARVGEFGLVDCSRAAAYFNAAYGTGQVRQAFQAGDSYRTCATAIDELEQRSAKR